MTALEQLDVWAASPDLEIYVGTNVGDLPYVITRLSGSVLTDFKKRANADEARLMTRNGIACVTIAGDVSPIPGMPPVEPARYHIVIAPVDLFH